MKCIALHIVFDRMMQTVHAEIIGTFRQPRCADKQSAAADSGLKEQSETMTARSIVDHLHDRPEALRCIIQDGTVRVRDDAVPLRRAVIVAEERPCNRMRSVDAEPHCPGRDLSAHGFGDAAEHRIIPEIRAVKAADFLCDLFGQEQHRLAVLQMRFGYTIEGNKSNQLKKWQYPLNFS